MCVCVFVCNSERYIYSLFLLIRLQSPPEVSLWKVQQQGADWHHGAIRSREIHSDEYTCRLQVWSKIWIESLKNLYLTY